MSVPRLTVGIVGAGHAALVLGSAWQRDRSLSLAIWARRPAQARRAARRIGCLASESLDHLASFAQVVVLAVPDAAVADVAQELSRVLTLRRVVLHLAGAWPGRELLAPLAPKRHALGVLHPLLPLVEGTPTREGLADISGDRRALRVARRLSRAAGLEPHVVVERERALLHLACVVAAGDVTALIAASIEWLTIAGLKPAVARRAALSLARAALDNLGSRRVAKALTGPAMRGDLATLQRHDAALGRARLPFPAVAEAHRHLSSLAVEIAANQGRISAQSVPRLMEALGLPRSHPRRTLRPARRPVRGKRLE